MVKQVGTIKPFLKKKPSTQDPDEWAIVAAKNAEKKKQSASGSSGSGVPQVFSKDDDMGHDDEELSVTTKTQKNK